MATDLAASARRLKLLLLSDLDGQIRRVTTLCEHVVCSADGDLNAVLVCGGHVAEREPSAYARNEGNAAAEGDMMALISRLETIVCRVLYIPGESDPPTTRPTGAEVAPNLTQYSVNCFDKTETLVPGVAVMGDERYMKLVGDGKDPAEGVDLLIVLRDLTAVSVLPPPDVRHTDESTSLDFHHIEIIGGPHQAVQNNSPVISPGSLRLGQFTILELAQRATDDSWTIVSNRLLELPYREEDFDDVGTYT